MPIKYFEALTSTISSGLQVVRGTHGTSSPRSLEILQRGFKLSENKDGSDKYQWLGSGVYFFENDETSALGWAKYRASVDEEICHPVVLMAILACDKNTFLDFNNQQDFESYREYYIVTEKEAAKHVDTDDKIDGLVLELLCKELNVAIIRACLNTFDKLPLQPVGAWSRLVEGMQVQVCVRNLDCVKAIVNSREIEGCEFVC